MKPNYSDITDRLGKPLWWDENGVPRYEAFHPKWCDIYAKYVAFIRVQCQACGREFKVASSISSASLVVLPTPKDLGTFRYGDPPNHLESGTGFDCLGGATMTSEHKEILEFWVSDEFACWHRHPEYEFKFEGWV